MPKTLGPVVFLEFLTIGIPVFRNPSIFKCRAFPKPYSNSGAQSEGYWLSGHAKKKEVPNAIWFGTGIVLFCIHVVKLVRRPKLTTTKSLTMRDIRDHVNDLKNQTPDMIQVNEQLLNAQIENMNQRRYRELFIVGLNEIKRLNAEYIRARDAQSEVDFHHALTLNCQDQNMRVNNAHDDNILEYLRDEINRRTEVCEALMGERVEKQGSIRDFKNRVTEIEVELDGLPTHYKNLNRSLERMSEYTGGLQNEIAPQLLHNPDFQSRKQNYLDWLNRKKLNVFEILEENYV